MYVYCLLRGHCLQHLHHMLSTLLSGETEGSWQVSASSLPQAITFRTCCPQLSYPKISLSNIYPTNALISFFVSLPFCMWWNRNHSLVVCFNSAATTKTASYDASRIPWSLIACSGIQIVECSAKSDRPPPPHPLAVFPAHIFLRRSHILNIWNRLFFSLR